jgi:hypothetical protein
MRTRKTVVVLISGLAGAGKTTLADLLEEKLCAIKDLRIARQSLASPIKFVAKLAFGWDGQKDERGRKLLQHLGQVGRDYNIDNWCELLLKNLDNSDEMFPPNFVLIDDWRFPNEFKFFSENPTLDTVGIRIFGRGGLTNTLAEDATETSLPIISLCTKEMPECYSYPVHNSGTIEDLETKIGEIVESLKKNYIVE